MGCLGTVDKKFIEITNPQTDYPQSEKLVAYFFEGDQ